MPMTTPLISEDGSTWNLHRAGNPPIPFAVSGDDLSAATVVFRVRGGPTVTLQANPDLPTGKLIVFTADHLAAIPERGAEFFIRNQTTGEVLLDGRVFARGFA